MMQPWNPERNKRILDGTVTNVTRKEYALFLKLFILYMFVSEQRTQGKCCCLLRIKHGGKRDYFRVHKDEQRNRELV